MGATPWDSDFEAMLHCYYYYINSTNLFIFYHIRKYPRHLSYADGGVSTLWKLYVSEGGKICEQVTTTLIAHALKRSPLGWVEEPQGPAGRSPLSQDWGLWGSCKGCPRS